MKRILFSLIATVVVSATAHAKMKFNLFVGGSTGGQLAYRKSAVNYSGTNSGVPAGFLLGYQAAGGFYTGLVYTYVGMGSISGTPATMTAAPTSHHIGGLELGYEGARFKVFASYNLMDTVNFYKTTAQTAIYPDVLSGTGTMGAGFGVKFGGNWSVDLKYYTHTFTTFDFGPAKNQNITSSSTFSNVSDTNMMIQLVRSFGGGK